MNREIRYGCAGQPAEYNLFSKRNYPLPKNGDTYKWHLHNVTEDIIEQETILAFEKAIRIWQDALDEIPPIGKFVKFESTPNIEEADFIISFGGKEHIFPYWDDGIKFKKCPFDFDGVSGVLAHAWTLEADHPWGGQMHMDEAESWGKMHTHQNKDLLTVFLHEFGHNLGIAHSEIKGAVMFPNYTGRKDKLHKDDKAALSAKLSRVKMVCYRRFHSSNYAADKFALLPAWVQSILNSIYSKRWN